MRAAMVGLGLACGCATSPAVDVGTLGVTSEPVESTGATSSDVASSEGVSSFSTSSEATSEPEPSSSVVVETSSPEVTSAPAPSSTTSSEVVTSAEVATSETSADATSAVTTDEPAPELTIENVVDGFYALGAAFNVGAGFTAQVRQIDGEFRVMLAGNQLGPLVSQFKPPLVEWVDGCGVSKAIVRTPPGMCATVNGDLKMTAQLDPSPACESDLVVPSCANAEHRSSRTRSPGESMHTEITTVTAYAYTAEECAPESAPVWSVLLYEGACPLPDP